MHFEKMHCIPESISHGFPVQSSLTDRGNKLIAVHLRRAA